MAPACRRSRAARTVCSGRTRIASPVSWSNFLALERGVNGLSTPDGRGELPALEEALRHEDDVARLEGEVLLPSHADVLHRDADLLLLTLDDPRHLRAVLRCHLGETAGERDRLDDGHLLLVGERSRLLHLTEDEDLLRVVLADEHRNLWPPQIPVGQALGERVRRPARSHPRQRDLAAEGIIHRSLGREPVGAGQVRLLEDSHLDQIPSTEGTAAGAGSLERGELARRLDRNAAKGPRRYTSRNAHRQACDKQRERRVSAAAWLCVAPSPPMRALPLS